MQKEAFLKCEKTRTQDIQTLRVTETQDTQRNTLKDNERFAEPNALFSESFVLSVFQDVYRSYKDRTVGNPYDNDPLFRVIRHVKGAAKELDPDAAYDAFCEATDKYGGWPEYIPLSSTEDERRDKWCEKWDSVKFAIGETPLEMAYRKAIERPLTTERSKKRKRASYDRFVSLAAWLQKSVGQHQTILLPCRDVAEVMHTDKCMVSIWRKWAIQDGYLSVVKAHRMGDGMATEFSFDLGRYPKMDKR